MITKTEKFIEKPNNLSNYEVDEYYSVFGTPKYKVIHKYKITKKTNKGLWGNLVKITLN